MLIFSPPPQSLFLRQTQIMKTFYPGKINKISFTHIETLIFFLDFHRLWMKNLFLLSFSELNFGAFLKFSTLDIAKIVFKLRIRIFLWIFHSAKKGKEFFRSLFSIRFCGEEHLNYIKRKIFLLISIEIATFRERFSRWNVNMALSRAINFPCRYSSGIFAVPFSSTKPQYHHCTPHKAHKMLRK